MKLFKSTELILMLAYLNVVDTSREYIINNDSSATSHVPLPRIYVKIIFNEVLFKNTCMTKDEF